MEENKQLNKNEIENEKQNLKKEIERLHIYKNCNDYELDKLLRYFPNKATKIKKCFCKKERKNVLHPDKKRQLQKIIKKELCSLLYPCIEKGCTVKQLNDGFCDANLKNVIILNTPEDDTNIGISITPQSKLVFTDGKWQYEVDKSNKNKLCLALASGIQQINGYDRNNSFHNEIKIFNDNMNYTLTIYPDTKDIKLTDFDEKNEYKTFCNQNIEIFKDKEDIIHFFSTLSFAETEQVLQILNEHFKSIITYKKNIKTVLKGIKDTIEKNRPQKQENGEEIDNKNKNSDAQLQLEMEEDDKICCNECITCLKQCWSTILMK